MQEEDFEKVYLSNIPRLHAYFHTCLKNAGYPFPYDSIKKELVHETGIAAYNNYKKGSPSGKSVEQLIWSKAPNVWNKFKTAPKRRFKEVDELSDLCSKEPDELDRLVMREKIEKIKASIGPEMWNVIEQIADQRKYSDIAKPLGENPVNLRMRVSRMRTDLKKKGF